MIWSSSVLIGHEGHDVRDGSVDKFYCDTCRMWVPKVPELEPITVEVEPTADGDGDTGVDVGIKFSW